MNTSMLRPVSLLALASAALMAHADFIDFESDSLGARPNGFASVSSTNVAFSDTIGANLLIDNADNGDLIGRGLVIGSDDMSALRMDFSGSYTSLSLVFGNDDPRVARFGDRAILDLFRGATLVGSASVLLNGNDLADQTVSYSGVAFDGAVFRYANAAGGNIDLTETVDNVTFGGTAVPGPAAALPFALMALRRRKRS